MTGVNHNEIIKRKKRKHNSISEKRYTNKIKRMGGLEYVGFSKKGKTIKQDSIKKPREMGPPCSSVHCQKKKERHCDKFDQMTRSIIFESFWKLPHWSTKQIFVQSLVRQMSIKNHRVENSRKKQSFMFFLYLNGDAIQVCRSMFLATLGLKHDMVKGWVKKTSGVINQSKNVLNKPPTVRKLNAAQVARKHRLLSYFQNLDKMDSHYCRRDSRKLYIAATFRAKVDIFKHYEDDCAESGCQPVSYFTFSQVFDQQNLSLFKPRKDQCDTCVGYGVSQISQNEYDLHIAREKRAKEEKTFDKDAALDNRRHTFTMDKQAVKLSPDINASAIFYKTRLQVHNFTVYNLSNHHCTNYWWSEIEGDLSASSFTSCVIEHLRKFCLSDTLPIVLFSDGCGYQNRNQYLSNALSNFAVKYQKIIEQKWLEKGHTQMECDSAHAKIEKKLKNKSIFVPYDYVDVTLKARHTVKINNVVVNCRFEAEYLTHDFFKSYADSEILRFNSIRPGSKVGDPTVTDLRSLIYLPNGAVKYKIDFDDEYQDLPRSVEPYEDGEYEPQGLHDDCLKIKQGKYDHLQELKSVIPKKYHSFYDNLPYKKVVKKSKCSG